MGKINKQSDANFVYVHLEKKKNKGNKKRKKRKVLYRLGFLRVKRENANSFTILRKMIDKGVGARLLGKLFAKIETKEVVAFWFERIGFAS